jgi:hypothetical protein
VKALGMAWLMAVLLPVAAAAQDVRVVVAESTRVMGAADLQSITYAGTAAVANFGQSRTISFRLASTTIQNYTQTIDFATGTSRASGYAAPPAIHGGPPTGLFEELVAPGDAWARQLDIWTTPWGFLRGAAAGPATLRRRTIDDVPYDVITWIPPHKAPSGQSYRVVGYIGPDRLVERVETWVGHPILGDMHVETRYSEYRNAGGMLVPGRIRQSRVGMEVFVAVIGGARANPPDLARLLQRSAPEVAPEPPVPAASERVVDGVYRIRGRY